MDPITLIVSALTAGAIAAVQETAGTAIKDAYQGLVALIKQRFAKDPEAKMVLDNHAKKPETWEKPLEDTIRNSGIAGDPQVLQAAQELVKLLKDTKPASKYNVSIAGNVQNMVQGDHAQVTINSSNPSEKHTTKKTKK